MNDMKYDELQKSIDKHVKLFLLMNQWTRLLQDKRSVVDYLVDRGIKDIAIYGYSIVGETLVRELKNTQIRINYIVDKNADYLYAPSIVIKPTDEYKKVDLMIVTAIDTSNMLIENLRNKCSFNVISIEEIVKEV